jgi:cell division protein ZapA
MRGRTVELRVGGQTYRVVTSATETELARLAAIVDRKLGEVAAPNRPPNPQTLLLAALALAHDLEQERARTVALLDRTRQSFGRLLERVDAALEAESSEGGTSTPADGSR